MVLTVKITVFWDVMPCNLVDNLFPEDNLCIDSCANQKPTFLFLLYVIG